MPLFALIVATSVACLNPAHRDGQSIRCGEKAPVMQLAGITAPAIPAACTNVTCKDDPGIAARDHLADLTRGQSLVCTVTEGKRGANGRKQRSARCTMRGLDLSCMMVADGMAEKSASLACPAVPASVREQEKVALQARNIIELPPLWRWVPLFLLFANIAAYAAFAVDHHRAARAMRRVAPSHLLALTFVGGTFGALFGIIRFGHLEDEAPFINQFAVLIGLQIGAALGLIALVFL